MVLGNYYYSLDGGIILLVMQKNNQKELMTVSFYSLLYSLCVGGPPICSFA